MITKIKIYLTTTLLSLLFVSFSFSDDVTPPPLSPKQSVKQSESIQKIIDKESDEPSAPKMETVNEINQTTPIKQQAVEKRKLSNIRVKIGVSKAEGDMYLPLASSLCIFMNEKKTNYCKIQQYQSSIQAAQALLNGDVDVLLTTALMGKRIADGKDGFDKNMQSKKLRLVSSLFNELLSIVVRSDSNIRKLDDLSKSSINLAQPQSKTRLFMENLIELKHWSITNFTEIELEAAGENLCQNSIKVMPVVGEKFNNHLKAVTRACEVNIVTMLHEDLELFKNDPQYLIDKIPGGTYVGIINDVDTIATKALLLTTSDIPDRIISFIIETMIRYVPEIRRLNSTFGEITPETMLTQGRIVSLHEGVIDFIGKSGLNLPVGGN